MIDAIKMDLLDNGNNDEDIKHIFNICFFDVENLKFKNIKQDNYTNLISELESDTFNSDMNRDKFICSELNENIVEFRNVKQLNICKENNYFNSSIIYFQRFNDTNKNELDELITSIKIKLDANYIDGYFLNEYLETNISQNIEKIYLEKFDSSIESIYETIDHVNLLKDGEYKNFLSELLKKSFNYSYTNLINNYIIKDILDNVTILINNKFEIYLDYINEKMFNEFLYYIILLNQTDALGNSTKSSLNNLFKNIKEKISESIDNTIENEIMFYIDIFYRENKNIFLTNYINYYNQEKNEYNITLYKIKNYLGELIYDKNFNKSLDNISLSFTKEITNEIKSKIKNDIDSKLSTLFTRLNNFSSNFDTIINSKETIQINEEMFPIYNLIQDFDQVVKNQNNRFNFTVNQEPFDIMNNFINDELRPPLKLIKEKYDFIEEQIANLVSQIVDTFPDFYSEIRDNFVNNKVESVYGLFNEVDNTFSEYNDSINSNVESYVNKLSFYTFINGLKTVNNPCNNSYCQINMTKYNKTNYTNKNRRLNSNLNKSNDKYHFENNNKKFKIKNKNILFKRKLESYDWTNPGLSKEDIFDYMDDIVKTINVFDKNYLGKEYKYIKTVVNKYLLKINGTCLNKLKNSFSIKLLKFSTLITEEKMEFISDKILTQYNKIEPFIHKRSDFIQELISNFTDMLNITKELNKKVSDFIYQKSNTYYDILSDLIHSKYKLLGLDDLNLNFNIPDLNELLAEQFTNIFGDSILALNQMITKVDDFIFNNEYFQKIEDFLNFKFMEDTQFVFDKDFVDQKISVSIPIPILPFLYLTVSTQVQLGAHLDLNVITSNNASISTNSFVRGLIGAGAEIGFYIPSKSSSVQVSIAAGLNGILASGKVGFKLNLLLIEEKYETDFYYVYNAFSFEFYVRYTITINTKFFKMKFAFDLIKFRFTLFSQEKHKIKEYNMKIFNIRKILQLKDKIKNAFTKLKKYEY